MKMSRLRVGSIVFALATFLLVATAAQAQLPPSPLPDAGKALPVKEVPVAAPAPTAAPAPEPPSGGNSSDQSVGVVQVVVPLLGESCRSEKSASEFQRRRID